MKMTSVSYEQGNHKVIITKCSVEGCKTFYFMFYYDYSPNAIKFCKQLPSQPTLKKAINEARGILMS